MRERVAQPPIRPPARDPERHDFWPGFVVTVIGLLLLGGGAWHATSVETTVGGTAWEYELVKAFTSGGLQFVDPDVPPDPASFTHPARAAEALERWEQARANAKSARLTYRVNPNAQTPCPT